MDTATARALLRTERERLVAVRRVLLAEHLDADSATDSIGELSPIDQHQADVASEAFEVEKELSLLDRVQHDLDDLDDALRRLERGTYGRCEACGRPIDDERLEAMPATRFCLAHQTYWEAARMTLAEEPAPATPGEAAVSIERLIEVAAGGNLDLLPHDDEVRDHVRVGPEEAALHEWLGGRDPGRALSARAIEALEARAAEVVELEREAAEEVDAAERRAVDDAAREEDRLGTDLG